MKKKMNQELNQVHRTFVKFTLRRPLARRKKYLKCKRSFPPVMQLAADCYRIETLAEKV